MSSLVDYNQTAEDHQTLLVLVRHTGTQLSGQAFNRAWERIRTLNCIHIQGQKRNIWVRYKRGYPRENNEWGDFQAHRKVLGLISVGKCLSHEEFEGLFESYKKVKEEYSSTIYNSRLVVFGMNTDGSPISESQLLEQNKTVVSNGHQEVHDLSKKEILADSHDNTTTKANEKTQGPDDSTKPDLAGSELRRTHSNSLTKESTGAEVVFYPDLDQSSDLEERLKEFVTSLFFVLEGKRLDRSFERTDRLQLLCAPFEKKDYVGIDTDTKSVRKKCMGRLRKHLADLCLQAGMPGEAILHYQTAMDLLRAVNDFLWIGGCYEGLSSSSVILTYPKMQSALLKRNLSFSVKRGSSVLNESRIKSSTYANGLDLAETQTQSGLHPDDIIEKYKDAIMHYSKYKNAAMIEMEACFKACRILIMQRKYLQASDFLQNVVYINLPSLEEDKMHRYSTLASLYAQIGFHRKASFFKRIAAMQCVTPGTPSGWHQCYYLLLQALEGYNIYLDPKDFIQDHPNGWPVIQYRVMHELIYSARRMGNPQLAVRHMTFLLHTMYEHLNSADRLEAITGLESLTVKCEGTPHPLALENGVILPAIPLTKFPIVKSFKLVAPAPHLQPLKLSSNCDKKDSKSGVFIYTPLSLGSGRDKEKSPKVDFLWVEGDICEVQVQVINPLPDELRLLYMGLLTDGVEVEVFPANPSIPGECGPVLVKLLVTPKSVGDLDILGYSTQVLGVRSHCRLKDLPLLPQSHFEVEVVPSLPQVSLTSSLPKAASFTSVGDGANVVASATALLYAGQSLECLVTLQNVGNLQVEKLDVFLDSKLEVDSQGKVFSWCRENITSQLPLHPNNQLCFSVCIHGYSDFLGPDFQSPDIPSPVYSNRSRADSVDNKAVEAVLTIEYSGGAGLQAGYCRQCSLALSIDILPSLHITKWNVQSAESSDHCYLVFDLQNVSSHQVDMQYDGNKSVIIEPQQSRRVAVQIARVEFPPEKTSAVETTHIPAVYRQSRPVNRYSQYLANFVDIRWSIPATKVFGKVGIEHLKWNKNQLDLIQVSPVRWEVRLNEQLYLAPDVPRFCVGDVIDIHVAVQNVKGGLHKNVQLTVTPFQDTPSLDCHHFIVGGTVSTGSISILGGNAVCVSKIAEGGVINHTCAFVFHCAGLYRLDAKCHGSDISVEQTIDTVWRCLPIPQLLIVE